MSSTIELNEVLAAQDEQNDAPTPWSKFSKRAMLAVAFLGVVGTAAVMRQIVYAQDTDGDGVVSFGEMMSCNAGWFSSCTDHGDVTQRTDNNVDFNAYKGR
jgi:hypothetical protein